MEPRTNPLGWVVLALACTFDLILIHYLYVSYKAGGFELSTEAKCLIGSFVLIFVVDFIRGLYDEYLMWRNRMDFSFPPRPPDGGLSFYTEVDKSFLQVDAGYRKGNYPLPFVQEEIMQRPVVRLLLRLGLFVGISTMLFGFGFCVYWLFSNALGRYHEITDKERREALMAMSFGIAGLYFWTPCYLLLRTPIRERWSDFRSDKDKL